MPPLMHPESPLHIDGMLGLVQQGLQSLTLAKKTSTTLNKEMVTAIKAFIASKKGATSPLRERLDEFLRLRNTEILGHEELMLFIQRIGGRSEMGSIVRNLILQRIPKAAQALGVPFLPEISSESMQELMESWILKRYARGCEIGPIIRRSCGHHKDYFVATGNAGDFISSSSDWRTAC